MAGNNTFTKTEAVQFDEIVAGYEDALEISDHVTKYGMNGELAERSNDTIWRKVPYIITSKDRVIGTPVTALDVKQLAVPASLSFKKVVPWQLSATEMRDASQEGGIHKAASQRLASDINTAIDFLWSTSAGGWRALSFAVTPSAEAAGSCREPAPVSSRLPVR